MGNQRNVVRALENGRVLLDSLPYPEHTDNHFVVDPDKFDFYAMDCYRLIGDNSLAEMHARELIRKTTNRDGTLNSPMRNTEARLTLGVVAARQGDLEQALTHGREALATPRRSGPVLAMVGSELDDLLQDRFPGEPEVVQFHDELLSSSTTHDVA